MAEQGDLPPDVTTQKMLETSTNRVWPCVWRLVYLGTRRWRNGNLAAWPRVAGSRACNLPAVSHGGLLL